MPPPRTAKLAANDPRVEELIAIRDAMTQRVIDMHVNLAELKAAYLRGDSEKIQGLFGYTDVELNAISQRLASVRAALIKDYPAMANTRHGDVSPACPTCSESISAAFKRIQQHIAMISRNGGTSATFHLESDVTSGPASRVAEDALSGIGASPMVASGCNYAPYTAALLVGTTSGPVVYWLCAYAAYCGFCYGPTRDSACLAS